ncbi:hypothetical protein FACS1894190_12660 [Spirochaetia bacterium]|nr:hypothetical protein FACS1894190_12660 [Spirochaetia bacterium]
MKTTNSICLVLFFSIAFTVLSSCDIPAGKTPGDDDYREVTQTVPMFAVNTEAFIVKAGDTAVTILLDEGTFSSNPTLSMFSINGTGGFASLGGGAVTYKGPRQVTITGITAAGGSGTMVSGSVVGGQRITIAAAAQQTQTSYAIAVSVDAADLTEADSFKTTHAAALALNVDTVTQTNEDAVNAALNAYEALTQEQKYLVFTESRTLIALKAAIDAKFGALVTPYPTPVQKINFAGSTAAVTLSGLNGHSVYMVQLNLAATPVPSTSSVTGSTDSGGSSYTPFPAFPGYMNNIKPDGSFWTGSFTGNSEDYIIEPEIGEQDGYSASAGVQAERRDSGHLQRFIDNPLPASAIATGDAFSGGFTLDKSASGILRSQAIGDTKQFWLQNSDETWQIRNATMQASKDRCAVWVASANYDNASSSNNDNKITKAQAQAMAEKFKTIYNLETNVFGYEYGGGVSTYSSIYGGVDGDPKMQILIYDIDYDYTPTQTGGVMGFVNFIDEFSQSAIDAESINAKTNLAEILYIDAHFVDRFPQSAYSTLVHEFDHCIMFNEKFIQRDTAMFSTWYAEMMAQLAEDLISPMIGIPITESGHPVMDRFPLFLALYDQLPVMGWGSGTSAIYTYSSVYAWGAYLVRNFGGPSFVNKMAKNSYVDVSSINMALPGSTNLTGALRKFPEAFVYTGSNIPSGVFSFDKSVLSTISGTTYTYRAFDIRKIRNYYAGDSETGLPSFYRGTWIKNAGTQYPIAAQTAIVQSMPEWQRVSGNLTISLAKPAASNVETYIMVR